jgi:hypothetical protein
LITGLQPLAPTGDIGAPFLFPKRFYFALLFWILFTFTGYENDQEFLSVDTTIFREYRGEFAILGIAIIGILTTGLILCTRKRLPSSEY